MESQSNEPRPRPDASSVYEGVKYFLAKISSIPYVLKGEDEAAARPEADEQQTS